MMAPCYERARALQTAVEAAAPLLAGRIDHVTFGWFGVRVWSGFEGVSVSARYVQRYSPEGDPYLGGGHYNPSARKIGFGLVGLLRRMFGLAITEAAKTRRAEAVAVAIEYATMELQEPVDRVLAKSEDEMLVRMGSACVRVSGISAGFDQPPDVPPIAPIVERIAG